MRRCTVLLALVLMATPVSASTLTVENLWDFEANAFSLWAGDVRIVSASQVTVPALPDNYVLAPIDDTHPLLGRTSITWTLPASLDNGFIYGGLMLAGPLPQDSSYDVWARPDPLFIGDLIAGTTVFDFLWPATDGSMLSIFRATYVPGASDTPVQDTPEPSSLALLAVGGAIACWRRYHP